jgi:hypothetical protein
MTEQEWLACTDPQKMLEFLRLDRGQTRRKSGRRKLRLFACACLRGIWPLLRKAGSRQAVEVAERFADGLASDQELKEAFDKARTALEYRELGKSPYWQSSEAAVHVPARQFSVGNHASVSHASGSAALAWALGRVGPGRGANRGRRVFREKQARLAAHSDWLLDIFGNPFRPVAINPAWLTPAVVAVARAAYNKRQLPAGTLDPARLAVLADALEESGCQEASILEHLRGPGPHVRGCWVVDALLGK